MNDGYLGRGAVSVSLLVMAMSNNANANCTDAVIEGNQASWSGDNCHYQLVELPSYDKARTVAGNECEGTGSELANCILRDNVPYLVQRWTRAPWSDFIGGNERIPAEVRPAGGASFSMLTFGTDGEGHPFCPPSNLYKWPPAPARLGWTNPNNYNGWVGATNLGCRSQGPAGEPTDVTTTEPTEPTTGGSAVHARNDNSFFQHGTSLSEFSFDDVDPDDPDKKAIKFHQTDRHNNDQRLTIDVGLPVGENVNLADYPENLKPFDANDRGRQGDGNFRVACQQSHFAYNDPIVKPNVSNGSHLHMYWGKTDASHSTYSAQSMTESGGGSCNGSLLNRSAYWMPALMTSNTQVVAPELTYMYYKSSVICGPGFTAPPVPWSKTRSFTSSSRYREFVNNGYICVKNEFAQSLIDGNDNFINLGSEPQDHEMRRPEWTPAEIKSMPQGLQLISGNASNTSFDTSGAPHIFWSCGANGHTFKNSAGRKIMYDNIPRREDCRYDNSNDKKSNPFNDDRINDEFAPLNATIYFPQCMKNHDLLHNRNTNSDSSYVAIGAANEFKGGGIMGHVSQVKEEVNCPSGHSVRIPRLGILAYWDIEDVSSIDSWFLSSDKGHVNGALDWVSAINRNEGPNSVNHQRGGTLHADWLGGWHDDVQTAWLDECLKDGVNCSIGQTGTRFVLKGFNDNSLNAMRNTGNKFFPVPGPGPSN